MCTEAPVIAAAAFSSSRFHAAPRLLDAGEPVVDEVGDATLGRESEDLDDLTSCGARGVGKTPPDAQRSLVDAASRSAR
jgi:hypothetical protein